MKKTNANKIGNCIGYGIAISLGIVAIGLILILGFKAGLWLALR